MEKTEILKILKDVDLTYQIIIDLVESKIALSSEGLKKQRIDVCVAIAKLLAEEKKEPKKSDNFVFTGLYTHGHGVFLGPTNNGQKADKLALTRLDRFIKRNMPKIYDSMSTDGGPIVDGAIE